ncbi:MAG: 23S rRNA (guanosine(2251)-2'-O)-methyltransferase RlmB [Acidimicrobiia bacterium]|nr:23S rRNA (guanosine(2251)-2'-O)-methyltransferase RlmB [Acidimicrobiia bacterium]
MEPTAVPGIGDRLEGVHAVAAAIVAGRVTELKIEEGRAGSAELKELLEAASAAGIKPEYVEDVRPMAATTAPQGVVAFARPIKTLDVRSLVETADPPVIVVLDHAEDPRNVGAIARSAVAAGAGGMIVPSRRAAPLGATAFKAAVGAFEKLPVAVVPSIADAVRQLRDRGIWVVALDGDSDQSFFELRILDDPIAVIVGAEGKGVSRLASERADVVARLPMANDVESLNASVAAALALFEIGRTRGALS